MSITSTVIDRAETRFLEAADVLRPFVGCFWIITAERGAIIRVVPDGSTAISTQLQGSGASGGFCAGRWSGRRNGGSRRPRCSLACASARAWAFL